ncbi:MAG: hypothetical protein MUC36_18875 [Planctomycetes bacterium]|nr:hypothetical protein [Planctomycetota bacterium]
MNRFHLLTPVILPLLATAAVAQGVWLPIATSQAPSPRSDALVAHDTVRDRFVLFGGQDAGGLRNDTWEFDGSNWLQRPYGLSTPQYGNAMCYDRGSQRTVLVADNGLNNETWLFDGTSWQATAATTPGGSTGRDLLVYDASRGVCVLYTQGFFNGSGETWEWNGFSWTPRLLPTNPPRLRDAGMVFDLQRNRTVLFGGRLGNGNPSYTTWEYDGTNWTNVVAIGSPGQAAMACTYDAQRRRIVMFGGTGGGDPMGTYEYTGPGGSWQLVTLASPPAREGAVMVHDMLRQEGLLFGGRDLSSYQLRNDLYRYRALVPATAVAFGQGCAGSGVVPGLLPQPYHVPYVGMTFGVRLFALPFGQPAFVAFGNSRTSFAGGPLPASLAPIGMTNCTLFISPDVLVAAPGSGTSASTSFAIPNQQTLVGMPFYVQAVAVDIGGNAANLISTRALDCRIGTP